MEAAAEEIIITYIFTGEEERDPDENHFIIPQNVTHLIFHESVTAVPVFAFHKHPNIVKVYCHIGVKIIESCAFAFCPRLRRLIIPGVEVVEEGAFWYCEAVTDIECPKLETIGKNAFSYCKAITYVECPKLEHISTLAFIGCNSMSSINLLSVKVFGCRAFEGCEAMTEAKFGKNLESIARRAFLNCFNLERITIPLKNTVFYDYTVFTGCDDLEHVDLVEGAVLKETVDALLWEEWRNDMNQEIDWINQHLPYDSAGTYIYKERDDDDEEIYDDDDSAADAVDVDRGDKAVAIGYWIERVLRKIIHYKAEHRRLLNETAATLQLVLPSDIATNSVLPFLELPLHTFDGEEEEEEGEDENIDDGDDGSESTSEDDDDEGEEDASVDEEGRGCVMRPANMKG